VDSADGLRALAADGLSAREIGERLGISQRTVRRRLESHGIERANGRAQRVPLIIVPPGAETAGQSFGPAGELLRVLTYVNEQIAEYNAERSARSRDDLDHLIESAAIHLRQCGYRMERADA
jgi:DNA-binding transcriptional ArsR family regulator